MEKVGYLGSAAPDQFKEKRIGGMTLCIKWPTILQPGSALNLQ